MHASYLVGARIEFQINWLIMHKTSYFDQILNYAPSALLNMGAVETFQQKCLEVLKFFKFFCMLYCVTELLQSLLNLLKPETDFMYQQL